MKTAMELLGKQRCGPCPHAEVTICVADLELVAKRAREETRDACAWAADRVYAETGSDGAAVSAYRIRNLPVEAKP